MTELSAALGLASDDVVGLLAAAGRAPSLHNSQPWGFRVEPDAIEVWADPARRLPAADPHGREQRLACGAALFNLRLALHGHGVRPLVTLQSERASPDLIATVRYGGRKPPTAQQRDLLAAVPRRRTHRDPFLSAQAVTDAELSALRRAAMAEGAWLHVVDDPAERAVLQDLAAEATALQAADPAFQEELARWSPVGPERADGIPALPDEQRTAAHEVRPAIVVLSAQVFGTTSEVSAGQALERVLLTATAAGLAVSYSSQVVRVDATREQLRTLLHGVHTPQVLLHVGRGSPAPATPRRPVSDTVLSVPPRPFRGVHGGSARHCDRDVRRLEQASLG